MNPLMCNPSPVGVFPGPRGPELNPTGPLTWRRSDYAVIGVCSEIWLRMIIGHMFRDILM